MEGLKERNNELFRGKIINNFVDIFSRGLPGSWSKEKKEFDIVSQILCLKNCIWTIVLSEIGYTRPGPM